MERDFAILEERIAQLIGLCERLHAENEALRADNAAARTEQTKLYSKNRDAARQINDIIGDLQTMVRQ